jgi:arsenite methyltransferase
VPSQNPELDIELLRRAIQLEYAEVAEHPELGFHFPVGRPLAAILGYDPAWLAAIPESSIESFAGTGNPFSLGPLGLGEKVVDVGCGAGIDTLIAASMVGPAGRVIGVDMTTAMLSKARQASVEAGRDNVDFPRKYR